MKKLTLRRNDHGIPLIEFLAKSLRISKKKAKLLLDRRHVFVNGKRVWMARHMLNAKDEVEVVTDNAQKHAAEPKVLFHDEWYVIANKMPGILACGEDSLEMLLRRKFKSRHLAAAHRLDRDTSGCLVFALNADALRQMTALFKKRLIHKQYHAVVERDMRTGKLRIDNPIANQRAVTRIEVLSSAEVASHVSAAIETGRTHQIRKHLASIRRPVLGDRVYGSKAVTDSRLREVPRQMLHAAAISFTHPYTNQSLRIRAPLPPDFRQCLRRLGLK